MSVEDVRRRYNELTSKDIVHGNDPVHQNRDEYNDKINQTPVSKDKLFYNGTDAAGNPIMGNPLHEQMEAKRIEEQAIREQGKPFYTKENISGIISVGVVAALCLVALIVLVKKRAKIKGFFMKKRPVSMQCDNQNASHDVNKEIKFLKICVAALSVLLLSLSAVVYLQHKHIDDLKYEMDRRETIYGHNESVERLERDISTLESMIFDLEERLDGATVQRYNPLRSPFVR